MFGIEGLYRDRERFTFKNASQLRELFIDMKMLNLKQISKQIGKVMINQPDQIHENTLFYFDFAVLSASLSSFVISTLIPRYARTLITINPATTIAKLVIQNQTYRSIHDNKMIQFHNE